MNRNNSIITIQRNYRLYRFKKNLIKLKTFKLSKCSEFNELALLLRKKNIINQMKLVLNSLEKFSLLPLNVKPQVVLMGYMIKMFPSEVIGPIKDRHPIDKEIILQSFKLVSLFDNYDNITYHISKSINYDVVNYNNLFNFWKDMDKNRTTQNIIVSYHNRREHLNIIEKEDMNIEQKNKIINTLNNECKILLQNIQQINPEFDIENLKNNYKDLYNQIEKTMENIYKQISLNYKKAFVQYFIEDLKKNEYNNIYNFIKETNERLLLITPLKFKTSIKNKINSYNYVSLLQINNWNKNIIDYLNFTIDTVIIYSCKEDDEINIIWKTDMKKLMDTKYITNFPLILLEINNKIDRIIDLTKKLI